MKGAEIIKTVMRERCIGEADFFDSKFREHAEARGEAIRRMRALGFSPSKIGRIMGCSRQTVRYWCNPEERQYILTKRLNLYHGRPA